MKSLISPDNTWFLWIIIVVWAAISIYLEQKNIVKHQISSGPLCDNTRVEAISNKVHICSIGL